MISSLIQLFKIVLFFIQVYVNFHVFLLLLIFCSIPLWPEKKLGVTLILNSFCDLTCDLSWRMLCVSVLEKNVYYFTVRQKVLYMSISLIWSMVLFKSVVSLLMFCLNALSIIISGVLKSSAITVLLSNFAFRSVYICYLFRCSDGGSIHIYNCYTFLLN